MKPMLACPMKDGLIKHWNEWSIEEKFDGHRLIVHVNPDPGQPSVQAFARPRGDGRMIERVLPDHLQRELRLLPSGIYDGELLSGDTGTDVTRGDLAHERSFVVFDLLRAGIIDTTRIEYFGRRAALELIFSKIKNSPSVLRLATTKLLTREDDMVRFLKLVWGANGEGAILKRNHSFYHAGKRTKDWVKVKRVMHATLTVVGFEHSRGDIVDRGPFAIVRLRDDDGNETTVKTLNDFELARFERERRESGHTKHPAIGRKLVIEFPQRTRTGGYQGPVRWDRWENE